LCHRLLEDTRLFDLKKRYALTPGADALHGILFGVSYWESRAGVAPCGNWATYAARWLGEVTLAYATWGAARSPAPKGAAPRPMPPAQPVPAAGGVSQVASQGFHSFAAFKRAMGPAGDGMAWHHIVEQGGGNLERFGAEAIHSTSNLI